MRNRFLDPIYGRVDVDDMSMALFLSPEIQRLRYVRMCNINSLLISGASEPSRFEHVVGVYHLAKIWASHNALHPAHRDTLSSAAIIHDLQTGPFGHSMEYILGDNSVEGDFDHEDIRSGHNRKYLQGLSAGISFRGAPFNASVTLKHFWPEIVETVKGAGRYGRILSAELDIDNIDNVVRLSMHVGILSSGDARRIALGLVGNIRLSSNGLSVDSGGVELIKEWQEIRLKLYKILLWDWADFSAKAMLTRVMEDAVSLGKLSSDNWILTDDALISYLSSELTGEGGRTKEILDRLVRGALYEPVSMLTLPGTKFYSRLSDLSSKRSIEAEVSSSIGCPCIFHVIKDKAKTKRSIMMTNRETDEEIEIGEDSDQTLIAIFSSALLSASALQRADSQLRGALLRDYGIAQGLTVLPDPLDEVAGSLPLEQPSLF